MIVQCDKCTTKFRIADEKVTPGGVKVRCSRCAHVFVVSSSSGASSTRLSQNTAPVDASVMSALVAATVPSVPSESVTARTHLAPGAISRTVANTAETAAVLGFTGVKRPDAVDTEPAKLSPGLGLVFPPPNASTEPQQRPGPASSPSASDFSDLDEAFRRALAESGDQQPKPLTGPTSSNPPRAPLSVAPGMGGPRSSAFAPVPIPPAPTDLDRLGGPSAGADDSGSLDALYARAPRSHLAEPRFPAPSSSSFGVLSTGDAQFPPPQDGFPKPAPTAAGPSDLGDIPGLLAPADDDPFANIDLEVPSGIRSRIQQPSIDIPPPPDPMAMLDPDSEPLARIELNHGPNPLTLPPAEPEATAVVITQTSTSSVDEPTQPTDGRWPTLAGILLGLVTVVFVVPSLGQGAIESVLPPSAERVDWATVPGKGPVRVDSAQVTAYPSAASGALLVVSGDATNRTDRTIAGVKVRVEAFDGEASILEGESLVGVGLSEGQLTAVKSEADLKAAVDEAVRAHGDRGGLLEPGARRPFMIVFPRIPQRAQALEFRISSVLPSEPQAPR